jgi:hypothetical protein
MATSLDNIIAAIKEVALANGFVSVEELALNLNANADTLLPKLFIRLTEIEYSDFLVDSANEDYTLELIIIINTTGTAVTSLKTLMDLLLNKMFTTNTLLANMSQEGKIELVEANLTNDRDLYSKLGGEGVTLTMKLSNVNLFAGTPCS